MSSHSGGPSRNPRPSACDKRTQTESSYDLGEVLAPLSQRPCSAQISEGDKGDWESAPPSPVPPSSLPFPLSTGLPEPSQEDICYNITFQAHQLDSLIHSVEGSSFGPANQPLEVLLENLLAFFFPHMASMVTAMDHVLLHAPSVPKKYGGTGPDPLPALRIIPLCAPEAPAPPAPVALPPAPQPLPQATLLSWAPPAPPRRPAPTFAEVTASSPPAPSAPKLAHLHKACTKQGTKATTTPQWMAPPPMTPQSTTLWLLGPSEPLTLLDLQRLQAAVDLFHHPGSEVVNHPTSASIKFPHVPMVRPDGSTVSDADLLHAIHSHPRWQDVSFISNPRFIQPSGHSGNLSALVHCEVRDSHASSTAHSLLKSMVNFFGTYCCAKHGLLIKLPLFAPPAAGGVT
ncbi:hypothetical protein AX15_005923 [Amanita polypyramis BW_CC]|nr:hypothetical protein AX15_005923 [Amanita polypyramis BW_CC]